MSVAPRALGSAGRVRIEARSTADALRGAGRASTETTLVSRSRLSVAPLPPSVPAEADVVVAGALIDEDRPIEGGAIEIRVQRGTVVRTVTDARGLFSVAVPFEGLPAGPLDLTVSYQPASTFRLPAVHGPVRIDHLPPAPLPLWLLLVPGGVTTTALLLALRSARDRRGAAARRAHGKSVPAHVAGGLRQSRPEEGRLRASRRPPDPEIAGWVWDPTTRRGIAGALVDLSFGDERRSLACDGAGRFASGVLPPGEMTVTASAPAYLSETFIARLPHQGQLRDVRIELVPVRHRVMEIYRDAALRVLPERELWGFWTPRELLRFVKKRTEAQKPPLAPLTELFEEVYYAGHAAGAEHVKRASELAGSVGVRAPQ
jgi:hypothetical protein